MPVHTPFFSFFPNMLDPADFEQYFVECAYYLLLTNHHQIQACYLTSLRKMGGKSVIIMMMKYCHLVLPLQRTKE